jgi:hypothetical protein
MVQELFPWKARSIQGTRIPGRLPNSTETVDHHIPINASGQRLNIYRPCPSAEAFDGYSERSADGRPPCWSWNLKLGCFTDCLYDHSPQVHSVVRFLASRTPCKNWSEFREQDCCFGYICHTRRCEYEGAKYCRLRRFHDVDPKVAEWIEGTPVDHTATSG